MRAKIINEQYKKGSVWRKTDQIWLRIFLDQDQIIVPKHSDKFISLSYDDDSGSMDDFGGNEIKIEFDEKMIMDQGADEVYYEPEWMASRAKETLYITGYESEEDFEEDFLEQNEDADKQWEWQHYLETYEHEAEILMDRLEFKPGIIKHVYFNRHPDSILIEMLHENEIPYSIS